jgi:hypothetical protein
LALALDLVFFFAMVRSAPVWSGASVLWRGLARDAKEFTEVRQRNRG